MSSAKQQYTGVVTYRRTKFEDKVQIRSVGKPYPYRQHHFQKTTVVVEEGDVVVTIDVRELVLYMGGRAMASKSGVSKLQSGLITAKVTSRREVSRTAKDQPIPAGFELVPEA